MRHRHINLANATPDELEQLTQACEPASFGKKHENVFDETYRKAGKLDAGCFSPILDPFRTDLIKIIRGYLLEGTQSTENIKAELYKLNVYGTHIIFINLKFDSIFATQAEGHSSSPTSILPGAERCLGRS